MFASPSPVAPAAPTVLSQYWPAPMIGESPTRPGVHVDRAGVERHGARIDVVPPRVARVERRPPAQPRLARGLGEEVLRREAELEREAPCVLADEQHVVGVVHHRLRHERRGGDVLEAGHRAGPLRRPVHHARVELHDPFGVRQPAEPDRGVLGIELLDVDAGDDRVERIAAREEQLAGLRDAPEAVGTRHHRRPTGRAETRAEPRLEPLGRRGRTGERSGGQRGGGGAEEVASGRGHAEWGWWVQWNVRYASAEGE